MLLFPCLDPVCYSCPVLTVASWQAYRFLREQVRWYGIPISWRISHCLLWFIQSKALVSSIKQNYMFFWNSLAFSMIQQMLAHWSLVPLPLLNPALTFGSFQFTLKLGLDNFDHYFASVWDECNCEVVWKLFGIVFLWDWNENWPFPVHLLAFEIAQLEFHHLH